MNNYNDELSLEELDQVVAGMPMLPETEHEEKESIEVSVPKESVNRNDELTGISKEAVESLPFDEDLSEEQLDNIIAGFRR